MPCFGSSGVEGFAFNSQEHAQAVNVDDVAPYFSQFVDHGVRGAINLQPDISHLPSTHVRMSGNNGSWSLRRLIEQSEVVPDGAFVSTNIYMIPDPSGFSSQLDEIAGLYDLADRSSGLRWENK